jgi:predicted metal-binding protein
VRVAIPAEPPSLSSHCDRRVTIVVCTTCRGAGDADDVPRAGARLAEAVARHADPACIHVREAQCLANCQRGPSAVIARPGAWTYVFGGLATEAHAQALLDGANLLAAASDGLMPWRGRPEPLKRGMIARIPPLDDTP